MRTTATLLGDHPRGGPWGYNHLRSFDGQVAVAEERLGEGEDAPVRFFRVEVEGDRLTLADLTPSALVAHAPSAADVRVVETQRGPGLVYGDLEAMAAGLVTVLAEPLAWGDGIVYRRAR